MTATSHPTDHQTSESLHEESGHQIYQNPAHQLAAAKLGMWLFITTEILMFGGLFCLYAAYRAKSPAAFAQGSMLLDMGWGTINTIVLITSSFTIAAATYYSQINKPKMAVFLLLMTLLLGMDFLGIKSIEYAQKMRHGLFPGSEPKWHESAIEKADVVPAVSTIPLGPGPMPEGDAGRGLAIFNNTCRACHGKGALGVTGVAPSLVSSKFVASSSNQKLFEMVIAGRTPDQPESVMKGYMPPRGGNPQLTVNQLADAVTYLKKLSSGDSSLIVEASGASSAAEALALVPRWDSPPAGMGPQGLKPAMFVKGALITDVNINDPVAREGSMRQFLSVYYLMTGLHGFHVIIGLCVITWLALAVSRRKVGAHRLAPLFLGGLFWHTVDLIWLFLFPLLYLTGHH